MNDFKTKNSGKHLQNILLVVCAGAAIYVATFLAVLFSKKVEALGFGTAVAQLVWLVVENPKAIALLFVSIVLFRTFCIPYVLSKLEDKESFLTQLSLIVAGFLLLFAVANLGTIG